MTTMINGIELFMPASELAEHAARRAEFHGQRAEAYGQKVVELRAMRKDNPAPTFDGDADGMTGKFATSNSYGHTDPITALEAQARSHRGHAERFRFISTHTAPGATYVLSLSDVAVLEIGA